MQRGIIIRRMELSDLDGVYNLERKLFPNPWPKSFFETDLKSKNSIGFVVEYEGSIIGYSMASYDDGKFHITNIAVDREFQRQGIASKLMHILEDLALGRGCYYAYLEVRIDNTAAINLYRSLGYEIAYKRNNYYIDGDDAYVMEKELK